MTPPSALGSHLTEFGGYNLSMTKPVVYLLTGVSGSGKSWIAEHLRHHVKYVPYDKHSTAEAVAIISKSKVPILYDPTTNISTFLKINSSSFDIRLFIIVDDLILIKQRIKARGGRITKSLYTRHKRMKAIAEANDSFSGSSLDVLNALKHELSNDRPFKIYKATSPSGKVYVGKTYLPLKTRIHAHSHDALVRNKPWAFSSAIRKYGPENIAYEIVHDNVLSYREINYLEKYYILKFKSSDSAYGYNLTEGGDGGQLLGSSYIKRSNSLKRFYASEDGARMKDSLRKKSREMRSASVGETISSKVKAVRSSAASREKTSLDNRKRYESQEARDKLSAVMTEKYKDETLKRAHALATRASRARLFAVVKADGTELGRWDSATTCQEQTGLSRGAISACINGYRSRVGDYTIKLL